MKRMLTTSFLVVLLAACSPSTTAEVGTGGDSAASEASSGTSSIPAGTIPSAASTPEQFEAQTITGMTLREATEAVSRAGFSLRVVQQDGQALPVTKDYRQDRVNIAVSDGIVTSAAIG